MEINYLNFVLAFLVSVVLTVLIIFFNTRIENYIKTPEGPQKIHRGNISRLGGLSIYITLFIFTLFNFSEENFLFLKLLFVSFPVFVFGFFEDVTQSVTPKLRLFGSLISSVLFIFILDSKINNVGMFYIDIFLANEIISIFFTIFCVIFLIQAFNIIDGLNGLASGCSGIIAFSFTLIALRNGQNEAALIGICISATCLAFLKYNLISGLHTFYMEKENIYKNLLPPLSILSNRDEKELISNLEKINFSIKSLATA